MEFVHYGAKTFNPKHIYKNKPFNFINKPVGLWGCPDDAKLTWYNFVKYNWESRKRTLKQSFRFSVSDDTKLLDLNDVRKLLKYKVHESEYDGYTFYTLDWDRIYKEYDGIILYVSRLSQEILFKFRLTSYDVDSVCIWNLKKVHQEGKSKIFSLRR